MRKMQVSSQKTATPATPNATKSADSEPDVEQAKPHSRKSTLCQGRENLC